MRERYNGEISTFTLDKERPTSTPADGATCKAMVRLGEWRVWYEVCGAKARIVLPGLLRKNWSDRDTDTPTEVSTCGIHDLTRRGGAAVMKRWLRELPALAFYVGSFALVFVMGAVLLGHDRFGFILGLIASSAIYLVDLVRTGEL
jgi:hypothetical protein